MKLKFSTRDLLWLTLLAAVLMAWLIDRKSSDARYEKFWDELTPEKIETMSPYKIYPSQGRTAAGSASAAIASNTLRASS
jgi:hypothetical protein